MRLEDQSHTEKTVFISIQDSGEDCSGITLIGTVLCMICFGSSS